MRATKNKKKEGIIQILWISLFIAIFSYIIIAAFPAGTTIVSAPTAGANISRTVVLNATITVTTQNVSNVSFYFDNGTNGGRFVLIGTNTSVNLTNYTFSWDTTAAGVGEGRNFTINATATFLLNSTEVANTSSGTRINVTIDNTAPTITINEPADGLESNASSLTFNATIIDSIFSTIAFCNLTLDPSNTTNGANINSTTNIPNGTTIQFINTIDSGVHRWNITCKDNAGSDNDGSTALRSFTLGEGLGVSTVTIDVLDKDRNSKTKFGATDVVTIACTRKDDDGYNVTEILVKFPQESTFSTIETVVEPNVVNATQTLEVIFDQTQRLGDYIAECRVTDRLLNVNSSNITFNVDVKVKGGTSAFANKNFKPAVAKIKLNVGTVSEVGGLTAEGVSRLMQERSTLAFDVEGESHSLAIKELKKESIVVTISSDPFDVAINAGETKNVDVNNDGSNDIAVTFHQMFGRHADVTVKLLTAEERQKNEENVNPVQTTNQEKISGVKTSATGSLAVVFIVIIVIGIVGYTLLKRKKK